MIKLHKLCIIGLITLTISVCLTINVNAEELSNNDFYESVIEKLTENLDDETIEILESLGFKDYTPDEISELSLKETIIQFFSIFTENFSEPFEFLCVSSVIIIFCSMSGGILSSENKSGKYFEYVSMIFLSLISFSKIIDMITKTVSVIKIVCFLMKLLLPVLTAIIAFSGKPALALSSGTVSLYISEIIIAVSNDILTPLLCVFAAVSVCGSTNGYINISPVINLVKKVFAIILGFLGTLYSGVLTIRDVVAAGTDKIAVKGIKFVLGSAVPIVGSTISEGLSAVVSALSLFRNTFGILGIIVCIILVAPVFARIILWIFSLMISEYVAVSFGKEAVSQVFSSIRYVITMLLTLLVFMIFVFLISVSSILITGGLK